MPTPNPAQGQSGEVQMAGVRRWGTEAERRGGLQGEQPAPCSALPGARAPHSGAGSVAAPAGLTPELGMGSGRGNLGHSG